MQPKQSKVVIRDHSGACCGENRAEYLGEIPLYSLLDKDIITEWLKYMKEENSNVFKKTLVEIVKTFE